MTLVNNQLIQTNHSFEHFDIINLSLTSGDSGGDSDFDFSFSKSICLNLKKFAKQGTLVVKAAGNKSEPLLDGMQRFVNEETNGRMILVGNIDYTRMSKLGVNAQSAQDTFICTAGENVLAQDNPNEGAGIGYVSNPYGKILSKGTSSAAPIVTGALAILMEQFPQWKALNPEKYIDFIRRSAQNVSEKFGHNCGRGALDLSTAIHEAEMEGVLDKIQQALHTDHPLQAINEIINNGQKHHDLKILNDPRALLSLFIVRGNIEAVKLLFRVHTTLDINHPIDDPRYKIVLSVLPQGSIQPLDLALKSGQGDMANYFVSKMRGNLKFSSEQLFDSLKLANLIKLENIMRILKSSLENMQDIDKLRDKYKRTLLMVGLQHNVPKEIIDIILSKGADIQSVDEWNFSPIDWAIWGKYTDISNLLLKIDINHQNSKWKSRTFLHTAAEADNPEAIAALIKAGAKPDVHDDNGETPLHYAAKTNAAEAIKFLVKTGINLDIPNNEGVTPLLQAVTYYSTEAIFALIEGGANLSIRLANRPSPFLAIAKKDISMAMKIIDSTTDVKKLGPILFDAILLKDAIMLTTLLKKGADFNTFSDKFGTPLLLLITNKQLSTIKSIFMLTKVNVEGENVDGYRPLHLAAEKGYLDITQFLLEHNALVNCKTTDELWTPLHLAVWNNHEDIVHELIKNKADINVADKDGDTSLHMAVQKDLPNMIVLLLEKGANPNLTNKQGKKAIDLAENEDLKAAFGVKK